MEERARPIVVVSRCLGLEACRYNGEVIPNDFVPRLAAHATLIPVCPEVEIGLGVPREPIRLVREGEKIRAVQPATGQDVTERLRTFAERFLSALPDVDGFILKSRSPSCGLTDAKVFSSVHSESAVGHAAGLFAQQVLERFPGVAIADEGRLNDAQVREHFLTKLFTLARFRHAVATGSIAALIEFHTRHKFLLMAYHQQAMRRMGQVVANGARLPFPEVADQYRRHLHRALQRAWRRTAILNVLQHGLGYVSPHLTAQEKAFFLKALERYRKGGLPLSALLCLLRAWIVRLGELYLMKQTFFEPYPEDLVEPGARELFREARRASKGDVGGRTLT